MPGHYPRVTALIRQVEEAAAQAPDSLSILVAMLRLVIESDADPYYLSGALVEGIVKTVATRIPAEKRAQVAIDVQRLLADRLGATGSL